MGLSVTRDLVFPLLPLSAPYFRLTQIVPELQQQCGQANVNGTKLRNMLIPLPPLAEQHLIVTKVHELMGLCDQLEMELSEVTVRSRQMLEAMLHHALSNRNEHGSRPDLPIPKRELLPNVTGV